MDVDSYKRIEPFLIGLKTYCRKLTLNDWDAEDLMQDSLIKLNHAIQQSPERILSKAYIRRIASNTWIDHQRRQQATGSITVFDETFHQSSTSMMNEQSIRETFELLAHRLSARQMVLILLMDIFQFSASETADLLHTTIGAIKEGLKRARHRLVLLAAQAREGNEEGIYHFVQRRNSEAGSHAATQTLNKDMFEQFLASFRAGDPEAICRSYLSLTNHGIHVEKVSTARESYYFTFRDPNGHLISFFQEN